MEVGGTRYEVGARYEVGGGNYEVGSGCVAFTLALALGSGQT